MRISDESKREVARLFVPLLFVMLINVPEAVAQFPQRTPTPNDTLQSAERLSDKRVTFRIYAPKAAEVSITGDWIGQGIAEGGNLKKNEEGVWSITVGPLPADLYSYSFIVDGVKTLDPKNPLVKQGIRGVDSMVFFAGEEAAFEENRSGQHGAIRQLWYQSKTLETQRRMHVYTPPGYDSSDDEYPVFYLLHGGGDEDSGWSTIGRAGFILDNLLAAGKAEPMLVVMPNGSLPRPEMRRDSPDFAARRAELQNRFTRELVEDVIPFVEKSFRVRAEAEHRAIAGLSMGGGQTLRVLTSHPDKFAHVGIWSAGLFGGNAEEWEERNAVFLEKADEVNESLKRLEIVVGDLDFALNGSKSLSDVFKKHGIQHELRITGGGHTWINWRQYLRDLAQHLFRAESYSVTIDPTEHGSLALTPPLPADGKYKAGTVVTASAKAGDGYEIDSVYYSVPGRWGAMYHESLTTPFAITIDQDKHIGASFIKSDEVAHVNVHHDIVYAKPGKKTLKYDVFSPKGATGLPVIIIIHGGGWATNDENIMRGLARELTKGGKFVVCSVDYRWIGNLDGDDKPNSMANLIEDVFGAIAHIMEHARGYGGDPSRIGVTGDSAGGHLSASASILIDKIGSNGFGVTEGVYEFLPSYLPKGKSVEEVRNEMLTGIKAAAPSYGVFASGVLSRFQRGLPAAAAEAIAPQSHIPPAAERSIPQYLLRGTEDFLIQDAAVAAFTSALQENGQTVTYEQVEGAGHAFFDWKPNAEVKATFEKYGVPYAAKMKAFFEKHLYSGHSHASQ